MQLRRHIIRFAAWLGALLCLVAVCPAAYSQSPNTPAVPSLVEIYWNSSRSVAAPGITNVIVLDPEIARADVSGDSIQFFGLGRGETVALGYINDKPVSIRLRVIQKPFMVISPAMLRRQSEMAYGTFGSTVQVSDTGGVTTTSLLHGLSWSQMVGTESHLNINSQVEDNDFAGGHAFNIRHASVDFHSPTLDVHGIDFLASLTDTGPHLLSPFSGSDMVELRGAGVTFRRGDDSYTFFGGTTIPFYYLTLGATRDIGGFSFQRKQTEKLSLFSTTSYLNIPADFFGQTGQRRDDFMETAGFNYELSKHWEMQGAGGISNHGGLGRGEVSYTGPRLTAFGAASFSSPLFPLNQIQSLLSGTSSVKAGATFKNTDRLVESVFYQHSSTQAVDGIIRDGSADYLSPSVGFKLTRLQDLNFTYTYSHNDGGFASRPSSGNRFDTNWRYQFLPRISNDAQFIVGSLQDPLQLNSEDEISFRDSVSFPVKGGNMFVAFQHDRRNPSLVQKLNSELNLLSPGLQNLFLQDPVSFVQSGNLPPEVRALLNAQQPISTSISTSGQFHLGSKVNISPSFSFAKTSQGAVESWTPFVGYGLSYQFRPSLQFTSSMNNVWIYGTSLNAPQRTTIFSFGFVKSFSSMPVSLVPLHHSRIIEGRVFRDNNINGFFNAGDQGMVGVRVQLENGETTLTDEQGHFKFTGVTTGEHRVSVSLNQFPGPVRMTTKNEAEIDLIQQRAAVVNFGVVNFARLMGNVFNDLRFDAKRQPDSRGLPDIHLILDDGKQKRTITTVGVGGYEIDDVPPGDYRLSVDVSTLPANYAVPVDNFPVHIAPVTTVVQDIPMRAMRSIAGRVFLKVMADAATPPADPEKLKIGGVPAGSVRTQRGGQAGGKLGQAGGQVSHGVQQGPGAAGTGGDYNLVPLAGVQLSAGFGTVKTDENGNFLLRDLPAGDLKVSIVPVKAVPEGVKVPSGVVRLPAEPIQVQGATIVISNPDLVPYLTNSDQTLHTPPRKNETNDKNDAAVPAAKASPAPTKIEALASQPAGAEKVQPAPARGNQEQGRPAVGTPLGRLGSAEQRTVAELTMGMTSCFLGHDCKGLQNSVRGLASDTGNIPRD